MEERMEERIARLELSDIGDRLQLIEECITRTEFTDFDNKFQSWKNEWQNVLDIWSTDL